MPWQDWLQCQLAYSEACAELGLPAPQSDPRPHLLRARAFAGLRRPGDAVAEFAKAHDLSPVDPEIRLQLHHARARFHVAKYEWGRAADEFEIASELLPTESYLLFFQAISHLADSDVAAYRRVCAKMLDRFGATQDPRAAHTVAELCTIIPDAVPDPNELLPAARIASGWYPGASRIHGAVLYRTGDYQQAVAVLEASAKFHSARAGDLFFLSMAQQRLGNTEEARRCLAAGVAWLEASNRPGPKDLHGTKPAWGRWDERVVVPLLRREAETLLLGEQAE